MSSGAVLGRDHRDYCLARISRSLGCAGYSVDESDAIMKWVETSHPSGVSCRGCDGTGRRPGIEYVPSSHELRFGLVEHMAFLVQGICLACRGRGVVA